MRVSSFAGSLTSIRGKTFYRPMAPLKQRSGRTAAWCALRTRTASQPWWVICISGTLPSPASAGRLACSCSAELGALLGSLWKFAPLLLENASVLIPTDSQSLLNALAQGPLLTDEDFADEIYALLLTLARRGCLLTLKFFFSHVPPPRNEAVNAEVTALLDAGQRWTTTPPPCG